MLTLAKEINEKIKVVQEDLDEKVIKNVALYSRACISPMAAFFGGVVA